MKRLSKFSLLIILLVFLLPNLSFAKNIMPKGFSHDRGKEIVVAEPLGWPVKVQTSSHMSGTVESLPEMAVIRLVPYNPWWRFFGKIPDTTEFIISGLPADMDLHIYTKGYREHEILHSDKDGRLFISLPSKPGNQIIIKSKPSTYHINIDSLFGAPGGDCKYIGSWNVSTKTCNLNAGVTISQTITIDEPDIILNGNNAIISAGSGDGIYTDVSNVTVKNLTVSNSNRGIVFADSFLSYAPVGGLIKNVHLNSNATQIMDDDISSLVISNATISGGSNGISLVDNTDNVSDTNNIQVLNSSIDVDGTGIFFDQIQGANITRSTIKNSTRAVMGIIDGTVTMTRNNFIDNSVDLVSVVGNLVLSNSTSRGNFWKKFNCTQDPVSPNNCTNSYSAGSGKTDNDPWACENAWATGVSCPVVIPPPPPPPGGDRTWAEISSTTGTANIYETADISGIKLKTVPNSWAIKVLDNSGATFWKVEDVTDSTIGYVEKSLLNADVLKQTEFQNKAFIKYETKETRVPIILDAVNLYHNNQNSSKSLFDPGGGIDNNNNFSKYTTGIQFPKELHLATIAQESSGSGFNNNKCSYASDGGIGISQITTSTFKGLGSGLKNSAHLNDCVGSTGEGLYYSNTLQGIYANIKDGFRVFQTKYEETSGLSKIDKSATTNWWSASNYSVNKRDMKVLILIRAYNGYGQRCKPFFTDERYRGYMGLISDKLKTLNTYFPNTTYPNSDFLIEKLKDAGSNHVDVSICSPAYLSIVNDQGKISGYNGNIYKDEIPEVDFDNVEKKAGTIIFPQGNYTYLVTGYENGPYSFLADRTYLGSPTLFESIDIPISVGEVHKYYIDWQKKTATIDVDKNGDGVFKIQIKSDLELTATEFNNGVSEINETITICHIPPGNPENAHTITVGKSALKAHILHGDYEGHCGAGGPAIKGKIKKNK